MRLTPRSLGRRFLPLGLRRWLSERAVRHTRWPPVGRVRFGGLRRLGPISGDWGFDRGRPIDRYYIERFLAAHAADIHGHVLEVDSETYTHQFGGERVTRSDVLSLAPREGATIVGDLASGVGIPSDRFDCVILTQTLQLIFDVRAAVRTLSRILRPGGVVLVTVPGISKTARDEEGRWASCWGFTALSARLLFEECFPAAEVNVESDGNVLAAVAFLHGLAAGELRPEELEHRDPEYELVVTVRARKPAERP